MGMNHQKGEEPQLKGMEIAGYGLGGFASTLPNQFKTQFGMNFMSDVAGIPIGIVGILSMAMSVWDAVNDPIIGHIADSTSTKRWGRYRPHMFIGAFGLAATVLLQFWLPPLSYAGRILYYAVIMALFCLLHAVYRPVAGLKQHHVCQSSPEESASCGPPACRRCGNLYGWASDCPARHKLFFAGNRVVCCCMHHCRTFNRVRHVHRGCRGKI